MSDRPTLFVCHGDESRPRMHPCGKVQAALRRKGIAYDKVIGGHGHPIPFLRKGTRDEVLAETGDTALPALKLADGTVIRPSKAILAWVEQQRRATPTG